jgi:hypothetical protein
MPLWIGLDLGTYYGWFKTLRRSPLLLWRNGQQARGLEPACWRRRIGIHFPTAGFAGSSNAAAVSSTNDPGGPA